MDTKAPIFLPFESKPITRMAFCIAGTEPILELDINTYEHRGIPFKAYEQPQVGDWIVRLTEADTYHVSDRVFRERNIVPSLATQGITPPATPNKVTLNGIMDKIQKTEYFTLEGTSVTICNVTMENGFDVRGESSCVDHKEFNKALGEKYSHENAINAIWPLEGYLLAEQRFQAQKNK